MDTQAEIDIEAGLRQLSQLHRKLMELLEWEKLALQEHNPRRVPAFDLHTSILDDIRCDIRTKHGHFLHLAVQIDHALQHASPSDDPDQLGRWLRRLRTLERQVAQLNLLR